jgi:ubiquinone biosynthesis protein
LVALLGEQRRTNRLLQALLFGAVGFLGGVLLVRAWLHWWPAA